MNIGKKIKRAMKQQGITDSQLAEKMGISRQRIGQLKRAKDMNVSTIVEVSKHLGFSHFYELTRIDSQAERERRNRAVEQEKDAMKQMEPE